MPTVNNVTADHHVYVVPGIVDGDVVADQARRNMIKKGETTYVHHHPKHVIDPGTSVSGASEVPCIGHNHDHYVPSVTTPSA